MERKLVILYDCPIELELEHKIKLLLQAGGWQLYSQDVDEFTNERDLMFINADDEENDT